MAYLFLGTKATQASDYNDTIRIYNKKAAAELEVDEKYSYQLYITLGLKDKADTLEKIATDELAELEQIKNDIIRLYEEIYGKHAEKHDLIETYLKKVDDAVKAIRDMCEEIDKELTKDVEDLSDEFQHRIDEITGKLNKIINKHLDSAKKGIKDSIDDIVAKVSTLTNYNDSSYQTFVNDVLDKLDAYLESTEDTETTTKADFDAAVDKLVDFEGEDAPFQLEENDTELYNSFKTALTNDADTIKTKAEEIKQLTFEENNEEQSYTFNGEGDFEHDGTTYDIDGDGKVYVHGETEPKPVNTDEPQNTAEPTSDDTNGDSGEEGNSESTSTDDTNGDSGEEGNSEPTSTDDTNGDSGEEENQEPKGE